PLEVFLPHLNARVEQGLRLPGDRIDPVGTHPLAPVTARAREREVAKCGFASLASRCDVIDGKCRDLTSRGEVAILAAMPGPGLDLGAHRVRTHAHGVPASSGKAAWSCWRASSASSFSMLRCCGKATSAISSACSAG